MKDLNAHTVDHAAEMIAGTAVSMGFEVDRWKLQNSQNQF
jgi:large subunit ribosomal protein L11